MAETVNEKNPETEKKDVKRRFSFLVGLACFLSLGSLAYSTWSFLDLNKVTAVPIEYLGGLSLVGLSAAAAMDVFWSATMVAEYQGKKILWTGWGTKGTPKNILPFIGWMEALAVAALLGYHGHELGGWTAAFTAILPLAAKFTWTLAHDDLRDPTAPTDDEMRDIYATEREANVEFKKIQATEKKHEAEMEARRRENDRLLEDERAQAERELLKKKSAFELKELELRQENQLKALDITLKTELQMSQLDSRMQVEGMREDHAWQMNLRNPTRMISGQVVNPASRPALTGADGIDTSFAELMALGLSESQAKRADLARRYYTADHTLDGVKRIDFCEANGIKHASRLSEATTEFPREWFIDNNVANWLMNSSN
jgi:hypothetical protein